MWISPRPDGHLQATGRDARGRKQYRYHPDWRAVRDVAKFARMVPFGRALPVIRRTTAGHLRRQGLPREKVLAAVVRLLERSLIRIGNPEYARDNDSFGGTRRVVGSGDVNEYLREVSGETFTAKDFRTWAGTLHAAAELMKCGPCADEAEGRGRVKEAVERVAERLRNTPAESAVLRFLEHAQGGAEPES